MISFIPFTDKAQIPVQAHEGDAAFDLHAYGDAPILIAPGQITVVPTGLSVDIEEPFIAGLILSRSGLSSKGLVVANAPGLIDSGYKEELKVILANIGTTNHVIHPGDRIAQIMFIEVLNEYVNMVKKGDKTREGGLGSSGT